MFVLGDYKRIDFSYKTSQVKKKTRGATRVDNKVNFIVAI